VYRDGLGVQRSPDSTSLAPTPCMAAECRSLRQHEMALLSDLRLAPIRPAQLFALRACESFPRSLFG